MLYVSFLQPIETCPKDGSYFIAWGPSGYGTTPLRCAVCRHDSKYRPKNPIVDHSNDAFTDSGEPATHWSELPYDAKEIVKEIQISRLREEIKARQDEIKSLGGEL